MGGHAFMFRHRDDLQQHRPRWQCGTCRRVSSGPLDCCTRPDVAPDHSPELTHLLSQWLRTCRRWTRASVRLLGGGQHRSATRAGATQATASPHRRMITGGVMLPSTDYDTSPEEDDVMVAAGERQSRTSAGQGVGAGGAALSLMRSNVSTRQKVTHDDCC
jgi:hypothetical protein